VFYSQQLPFACLNRFGVGFVPVDRSSAHPRDRLKVASPVEHRELVREAIAAGAALVRPFPLPLSTQSDWDAGVTWQFPPSHSEP
jgi:hypothetical protein